MEWNTAERAISLLETDTRTEVSSKVILVTNSTDNKDKSNGDHNDDDNDDVIITVETNVNFKSCKIPNRGQAFSTTSDNLHHLFYLEMSSADDWALSINN